LKDLDPIADVSLATWGERHAEKYLSDMAKRFEWLGKNPCAGRMRDETGEGYLSYRQGSHLIFDSVDGDIVAIIGIPYGSTDVVAFFQSPA
jgi:plasmid stabilization system protein ParE